MVTVTNDRVTVMTVAVCDAIAEYRRRQGLTRAEFAARAWECGAPVSFTATVVGVLETGRRSAGGRRREITLDELAFLAATMDCSPLAALGELAPRFGSELPAPTECARCAGTAGAVLPQVREDVEALGELVGTDPSLAEAAYVLAAAIDVGCEPGQLPRLTKELRETLAQLAAGRDDGGDEGDDDEFGDLGEPE